MKTCILVLLSTVGSLGLVASQIVAAAPTPVATRELQSCNTDSQLDFYVNVVPDLQPEGLSYKLFNRDSGQLILSKNDGFQYAEDHIATACLPIACYTFTLFDSFGDGILDHGGNPGYVLQVNSETIVSFSDGSDFGSEISYDFGSCGPDPPQPPDWVALAREGFEKSTTIFLPGSAASILKRRGYKSSSSLRLKGRSGATAVLKQPYNIANYKDVLIKFQFLTSNVKTGEKFAVDIAYDGGGWSKLQTFKVGTEYRNYNWYSGKIKKPIALGASTIKVRFRALYSNQGVVLIDDFKLFGSK